MMSMNWVSNWLRNFLFVPIFLCLVSGAEGNLQNWSVKQKPPPDATLSRSTPFASPESGGFGSGMTSMTLPEDPTCTELLYGSSTSSGDDGTGARIKETQRGQLTLDILTCILKELRRGQEKREEGVEMSMSPLPFSPGGENEGERKYLPLNYNRLEVPLIAKPVEDVFSPNFTVFQPVHVDFFLNVQEVMDFSEVDHFLGFDVEIIAGWTDGKIRQNSLLNPGLDNEDIYLSGEFLDKIWAPDLFFEQIASSTNPNVGVVPKTIVLNPGTGYIKFKTRMLLNLYCDFDFFYYPADTQECHFTLRSYSYTTKLVNISWFDVGIYLHRTFDYNFEYQVLSSSRKNVPERIGRWENSDETHATLEFVVKSRRKLSYHLVQTYVPSVLLAVVTWLCFLVPREQSEVRVGVAMTTLLTITAMFSSVRASAPVVSYVKAIDIWMFGCIFFIFATLAGFLAIAWMQKREKMRQIHGTRMGPGPTFHPAGFDSKDIADMHHIHHNEFCPIHSQFKAETPSPPSLTHTTTLTTTLPPTVTHPRPVVTHPDGCDDFGPGSSSGNGGGNGHGVSCSGCGGGHKDHKLDDTLILIIPSSFMIFVVFYWTWLLFASGYYAWTLNEEHNRVEIED